MGVELVVGGTDGAGEGGLADQALTDTTDFVTGVGAGVDEETRIAAGAGRV